MRHRKAFTLIELLVVIGIMAVLAGILLPVVVQARRSAQITAGKADLQAISTALESYHNDFGDYPRNIQLPTWPTQNVTAPPPVYLSLAAALMGPGPGVTQQINGALEVGDGADGIGSRTQAQIYGLSLTANVAVGDVSVTVNGSAQAVGFLQNNYVYPTTVAWITLSAGNPPTATDPEETLGIGTVSVSGPTMATIHFATGTTAAYAHPTTEANGQATSFVMKVATGKAWPNYLSADSFKVAYIPKADVNSQTPSSWSYGEPVLLDRWGQVIQYFPRYGSANNRFYASVSTNPGASVSVGPLYGYSQPSSVDVANGENAIWDFRDGSPFYTIWTGSGAPPNAGPSNAVFCQQWEPIVSSPPTWVSKLPTTTPGTYTPYYFDPVTVLLWKLGALDTTTTPPAANNYIDNNCSLAFEGPYILISAGPDGPDRINGGFCSFIDNNSNDPTYGQLLPSSSWQQIYNASGNIYNFGSP